jgi:hypothetical protein
MWQGFNSRSRHHYKQNGVVVTAMNKSFDIAMLDEHIQTALYLTWISCKDFKALNDADNQERLNGVWLSIKKQLMPFFEKQDIALETISSNLREFVLSIEPSLGNAYNPRRNALEFNLWGLFFDINRGSVIPSLPWKIGSELVHEHDHCLFLSSMGMIGKDEKAQDDFSKANLLKAEVRAYSSEANFLRNCKERISHTVLHQFRIDGWTSNGQPFPMSYYECTCHSKAETLRQVDLSITDCFKKIEQIKSGVDYEKFGEDICTSKKYRIARILSLPINLDKLADPFPETIIGL